MWTATTPRQRSRDGLRFTSGLTDAEWAVIEPWWPRAAVGRPPRRPLRENVDAICYLLRGSIPWRMPPPCFPPRRSVHPWFAAWRESGVRRSIVLHLVKQDRERARRAASPSAAVIDSRRAKTTEGSGSRGGASPWAGRRPDQKDAGKKVLGRKRHAMVDTDGRPLALKVHPAPIRFRGGAPPLLAAPFVEMRSTPASMECDRPISGPPAPIGQTSPGPRPGRKRTSLARSGRPPACGKADLDRPRARRLFAGHQ
jgi:putative transposase